MNVVHPLRPNSRVLIIEDHVLFAESLELALTLEGYDARRLPLPSHCGSAGQLLAAAIRLRPRVVLLDLDLGTFGDGVRLIHPLALSGANVVVVTASADRARWGECLRYGARKAMTKTQPLNEILSVVRRIHQGLPVADAEEREALLRQWEEHRQSVEEQRRRLESLTSREREVLAKLREGTPVRDIARVSVVSEATVRTQVKSILAKLGVTSQLAAVGLAHNAGWRPPSSNPLSTPRDVPARPAASDRG
jgi:two-component system nitrate/nitrite response regulator NarL